MLISFCGIDGSGKTSHMHEIFNWLRSQDFNVRKMKPIRSNSSFFSVYSEIIKQHKINFQQDLSNEYRVAFLGYELLMKSKAVEKLLNKNSVVLVDRWKYSHMAFAHAHDAETEVLQTILNLCVTPDVIFLLDIPVEIAMERIGKRNKIGYNENFNILRKARNKYLTLAQDNNFIVLDNYNNSFDFIQKKMKSILQQVCSNEVHKR